MVGYLYDASGDRIAKGTIHSVLVNGVATLSCDLTQTGFQLTESYVLGPGGEELTQFSVANGVSTWQRTNVYGGGKQLATYDIVSSNPALHFQLTDPLGSRRMQTNADGQPETDIQSLPFGDGLTSSQDQYAPVTADDATPLHFTGKERDTESGNDYFGALYYGSAMGRFMSPDWSAKAEPVPYAKLDNPQSLNLYAYVRNNPLTRVDADGHTDPPDPNKPPTPPAPTPPPASPQQVSKEIIAKENTAFNNYVKEKMPGAVVSASNKVLQDEGKKAGDAIQEGGASGKIETPAGTPGQTAVNAHNALGGEVVDAMKVCAINHPLAVLSKDFQGPSEPFGAGGFTGVIEKILNATN